MKRLLLACTTLIALVGLGCDSPSADAITETPTATTTTTPGVAVSTPLPVTTPTSPPEPEATPNLPGEHPGESPPSDALDEDGWPVDAVGPLVTWQREVEEHGIEVVVFDLGARREVASFQVGARRGPHVTLGGTKIFANYYGELWAYGLDGSGGRLVAGPHEGRPVEIEAAVPNADGSLVAVSFYLLDGDYHEGNRVQVIDVETGAVVLDVPQEVADAAGIDGFLRAERWSADGTALEVLGHHHRDGIGQPGRLTLDGLMEFFDQSGRDLEFIDPLGERPSVRRGEGQWCQYDHYAGGDYIELYDLETGEVLNAVRHEWPVFMPNGWSPGGREFLFVEYQVTPEVGGVLAAARSEGECGPVEVQHEALDSPTSWFALPTDGGAPVPVADRAAAFERWMPGRAVTFACGDEEVAGRGRFGWRDPVWAEHECRTIPVTLRVGGQVIGDGRQPAVLGFLERP